MMRRETGEVLLSAGRRIKQDPTRRENWRHMHWTLNRPTTN